MELLHWSELAGLVVVARSCRLRRIRSLLRWSCGGQRPEVNSRIMLLKLWPESLLRPLGERSLCCAPPSPWLDMAGARSSATTLVSEGL